MPATTVDSHARSLVKGLSWRVTATCSTILIALLVTGDAAVALTIGGIEAAAKIFIYYLHERLWFRIAWGRDTRVIDDTSTSSDPTTRAAG